MERYIIYCTAGNSELLESVQYQSARVVTGVIKGTSSTNYLIFIR